jgi:glycosyltransferase involved in cell wall biosynthesis
MKIICISASEVPSSTANSIQVMKSSQALTQLGHQVHLILPGRSPAVWEELAGLYGLRMPFELEWLPANPRLKRYDFCLAAVRRARAMQGDMIYVWPLQAAVFGLLGHLPVVLEMHGPPEGWLGPLVFRLFLKLTGEKRILPITRALSVYLEEHYRHQFTPGEVVISPNGVDLERYENLPIASVARQRLGFPEAVTVGYTGHLYPGRGMKLLVEMAHRFPQVQFLWVGGRPEDIQYWQKQLDMEKLSNVSLLGFVENIRLPLYQAAADILLMPYERQITGSSGGNSVDYCSPMKMFEYMGCGRAIISSDLPVIREILNNSNSLLCPPEDINAWEQALSRLVADIGLRQSLGQRAQQEVEEFTWQKRAYKALAGFHGQ